jgi:hypothetical protein
MMRTGLLAIVIALWLGACATAHAPATGSTSTPPGIVSPDDQPSNVQHPDTRSAKRGVIVPSDVPLTGSESPLPETASPRAAPVTGAER